MIMDSRNKENYHPALSSSFVSTPLVDTRTTVGAASTTSTTATRPSIRVDMKTSQSHRTSSPAVASDCDTHDDNVLDGDNDSTMHQGTTGYDDWINFLNNKRRKYSEAEAASIDNASRSSNPKPLSNDISTGRIGQESINIDKTNLDASNRNNMANLHQSTRQSSHQQNHVELQYQPLIFSQAEEMNPLRRTTMEDRCVIYEAGHWNAPDPNMIYIGVYDGHGGREIVDFLDRAMGYHVAEELSFVEDDVDNDEEKKNEGLEISGNYAPHGDDNVSRTISKNISMETRLVRAFLMADINSRLAGLTTSGATVAICLLKRNNDNPNVVEITTANVGDSRVVLGIGDLNKVYTSKRLTYDHRVDDALEIERIQRAGGFLFRNRVVGILAVTRSIGDHVLKDFVIAHPYVNELQLNVTENDDDIEIERHDEIDIPDKGNKKDTINRNKFLIIACDGLWDVFSDTEAVALVNSYKGKKEDVAQHLIQHSLQRGTTDNVTVVVVWLSYISDDQND